MASFNDAIVKTLAKEGGDKITEISGDTGGLTKYGISQASYPTLNIRALTEQQAREIYKRDYWDRINGDAIKSQVMAENIFDTAVNVGVRTSSRMAQMAIGIPDADGVIGDKTVARLNALKAETFLLSFTLLKVARYAAICNKNKSQSKFLLGWINRALGGFKWVG